MQYWSVVGIRLTNSVVRAGEIGKFHTSFTKFPLLISDYYYYTRVPIYTIIIICSTALVTIIIIISIANTDQLQLIVFNENDWFLKFFFFILPSSKSRDPNRYTCDNIS